MKVNVKAITYMRTFRQNCGYLSSRNVCEILMIVCHFIPPAHVVGFTSLLSCSESSLSLQAGGTNVHVPLLPRELTF